MCNCVKIPSECNSKCKCDVTIINDIDINIKNLIIICNDLTSKMEGMEKIINTENNQWFQEQVLRNGLETKNHDTKVVAMLEEMK